MAGYYVIPSEILSVRLSVRPSVSAHHHSCIGNSSYSFRPILLKLYRCFKDGLKICILFFQNPEIIFYHFFPIFNLDIFRALILQICIWSMYLVSATPPTVFGESFWNFTGVLRMVWRYAYCFFRILKLFFFFTGEHPLLHRFRQACMDISACLKLCIDTMESEQDLMVIQICPMQSFVNQYSVVVGHYNSPSTLHFISLFLT